MKRGDLLHRMRMLLAGGLLAAAMVRALWIAFTAYAIADHAVTADSNLTSELDRRYARVAGSLEGMERIGYREPSGNPWGTVSYLIARLELLPCVVVPDAAMPRVLFDAPSDEVLDGWLAEPGVTLRQRYGDGLALVEIKPP